MKDNRGFFHYRQQNVIYVGFSVIFLNHSYTFVAMISDNNKGVLYPHNYLIHTK